MQEDDSESPAIIIAGKYEVVREIGRGGTASVFEAVNKWSRRRVALKLLHFEHQSADFEERFTQEARTAASLTHENIVSILDFGRDEDGALYLVQEYLEGEDFGAYLFGRGRLSIGRTWALLSPVMGALAQAHETGVIHRDIKPQNIVLVRGLLGELTPKVVDFGLAELLEDDGVHTPTGILMGTPQYMPPEQLRGGKDLGATVDIWAMAVTLYEALAGQPPYDGESIVEVATKVIDGAFSPLCEHVPSAPRALDDFFWKALHRDPARRFPTMAALAEGFRRAAKESMEEAAGDTEVMDRGEVNAAIANAQPLDASATTDPGDGGGIRSDVLMLPRPARLALSKTDPSDPPIDEREHRRRERQEKSGTVAVDAPVRADLPRLRAGLVVNADDFEDPRIAAPFQAALGPRTRVSRFRTYVELVDALADGDVDIAWLPPVAYLRARQRAAADVLCSVERGGQVEYASALLVRRDSSIRDIHGVKGSRAVWVDPWSAAGYLVPRALLRAKGIPPESSFRSQGFVGSYDAVIAALRARTAEVGAAYCSLDSSGMIVRRGWKREDDLTPVGVSDAIPSDVLCASVGLGADVRAAVRDVLLGLDEQAPLLRLIGATHLQPADETSYTALAAALREET